MQKLSLDKISVLQILWQRCIHGKQLIQTRKVSESRFMASYPTTKRTISFHLQYWNHSGCLSLLPYSSAAPFFCCCSNGKEFKKHSRWQVTLFCDAPASSVITGWHRGSQSSSTLPAKQPCNANTCLQTLFRLTFTLYSQAIQGQTEDCKKTPQIHFIPGCLCFTG